MNNIKIPFTIISLLYFISFACLAKKPDCYGPDSWAVNVAFVKLKNAGITDNDKIDFSKTQTTKIAAEKLGVYKDYKEDLYREVQKIKFFEKSGNTIEVITVSEATESECSMGFIEVYMISKSYIDKDNKSALEQNDQE